MKIIDIIIIALFIVNFYLLYKISINKENFETNLTDINTMINNIYNSDMDNIKNISTRAKSILLNNDILSLDVTKIITPDLEINNDLVANELLVKNNLTINGNVTFTNKETALLDILPQYIVIAWNGINNITTTTTSSNTSSSNNSDNNTSSNNTSSQSNASIIPKGWALCDGKKYMLDDNGYAIENNGSGIRTPDLRGRFPVGSGEGEVKNSAGDIVSYLTERNSREIGGTETHKLTLNEMAHHDHRMQGYLRHHRFEDADAWPHNNQPILLDRHLKWKCGIWGKSCGIGGWSHSYVNYTGGDQPHNNMPPFYVLTYIMKL